MGFDQVHLADRILRFALGANNLDRLDRVDDHLSEQVGVRANELGAQRRLRNVQEHVLVKLVDGDGQIGLDVLDGFPHGQSIPGDDVRGVNVVLDQLVRTLQQLGCDDDDGRRAIADLAVLEVGQLDQNLRRRMLDLELFEDRSAVVGNGHVADVVHEHLVQALRPKRGLQDVRQRHDGGDIRAPHIGAALALPLQSQAKVRHGARRRAARTAAQQGASTKMAPAT
mmetsp:Transcript_7514/g.21450  ORF Transcript_7514/g.21450 Transcript_7514/m.21450 type:complete len:226 (+) Transcript_7514:1107-1784(+)